MLHGLQDFFEDILRHLLVEVQDGYQLFEVLIFLFQLLQPA
jgi:hypothetical protein